MRPPDRGDPGPLEVEPPALAGQDVAFQREVEAKMLLAALADVQAQFKDDDIIVIGDTNVLPTYVSGQFKNPFDRAFVPNPAGNAKAAEFAAARSTCSSTRP